MAEKGTVVPAAAEAPAAAQSQEAAMEAKARENWEAAQVKTKPLAEKANTIFTKDYHFSAPPAPAGTAAPKPIEMTKADMIIAFNDKVGRFWARFGHLTAAMWNQMSQEAREAFVRSYPVAMPATKGDEGENGETKGISLIAPEINVEFLSNANGLPNVFMSRFQEDTQQELRDAQVIQPHVKAGRLGGNQPPESQLTYTFLAGEGRGLWYKADDMKQIESNKVFTEAIDKGLMVDGVTYEIMLVRRLEVLRLLAYYADVLRHALFDTEKEYAAMRKANCFTCGKPAGKEGKLLACGRCMDSYYCSPDCQKNHWRQHKAFCGGQKPTVKDTKASDGAKVAN